MYILGLNRKILFGSNVSNGFMCEIVYTHIFKPEHYIIPDKLEFSLDILSILSCDFSILNHLSCIFLIIII